MPLRITTAEVFLEHVQTLETQCILKGPTRTTKLGWMIVDPRCRQGKRRIDAVRGFSRGRDALRGPELREGAKAPSAQSHLSREAGTHENLGRGAGTWVEILPTKGSHEEVVSPKKLRQGTFSISWIYLGLLRADFSKKLAWADMLWK